MESVNINVEGMSCGHCKMAVEKAISSIEGVQQAEVSLGNKGVYVEYDPEKVSVADIKKAVTGAGYSVE